MSPTRIARRCGLALLTLSLALVVPLRAAEEKAKGDEGKTVEQLAKEGHWGQTPEQWEKHAALLGKAMPKLELSEWINGEVKAEDMKGKIVVVDYWATWCGPCIASIPKNNELAKKYADKGVLIIGACGGRGEEKMGQIVEKHDMEYPTAKVTPESTQAWAVQWWPTYAVVDRKGVVRALGIRPDYVPKIVDAILKEQPAKEKTASASGSLKAEVLSAAKEAGVQDAWLEGTAESRKRFEAIEGKAAPALTVKEWKNAEAMKVADLKGKVVLLDFWATWCGPCIASIPHTNELQKKYKDKGLVIIGVCHSRGAEKMADMVTEKGIEYPVAADVDGKTDEAYKVDSYPDYYFIDRAGKLRIADCKNGSVEEAIQALLAESERQASAE
jgi:thiol-disulfide isomerase/thioredoxin